MESKSLIYLSHLYQKDYHLYSRKELMDIFDAENPEEQTNILYSFYENHPEAKIERPEHFSLTRDSVFEYYDGVLLKKLKAYSQMYKFFEFIPEQICESKFSNIVLQHPLISIGVFIYIVWSILIFTVGSSFFESLLIVLFGAPAIALGLYILYIILESLFVLIQRIWLLNISFSNKDKSIIPWLRQKQIKYLVDKN